MSNRFIVAERELADSVVEGVDFGTPLWVIARSPSAVLVWAKGHSWSCNGYSNYASGQLIGLPDRSPRMRFHPTYDRLWDGEGRRFDEKAINATASQIDSLFQIEGISRHVSDVVRSRKSLIVEGGGGQLRPPKCYGESLREWADRGGGFIILPPEMTEHESHRGSLGWKAAKPKD